VCFDACVSTCLTVGRMEDVTYLYAYGVGSGFNFQNILMRKTFFFEVCVNVCNIIFSKYIFVCHLHMCIYAHAYAYICIYMYKSMCIYRCTSLFPAYKHISMHVSYNLIFICLYVYVYKHKCVRISIHVYVYKDDCFRMRTYVYIYMYTCICICYMCIHLYV